MTEVILRTPSHRQIDSRSFLDLNPVGAKDDPLSQRHDLRWEMAILCSALLWGTLWIPLRALRATGLSDASATTVGFLLPIILLIPFAPGRWRRILAGGWPLGLASFCLAVSIALYAEGVVRGQVARVLLLFYLTPVWSTLLGRWILGEAITGRRIGTIILGFAGLAVIFGVDAGVPAPIGVGDWMGLTSGAAWALAMVNLHRTVERPLFDRIFVQFVFLGPIFFLVAWFTGGIHHARPGVEALLDSAPWLLAFALAWMLPVIWLTIVGASRLDPGRVAILLMFEVIVGLTTAALLTDEPFGAREAVGAGLILAASGTELTRRRRS
jgi:drug/metabolite transporter (DMT)-like permease